VCVCVCVFVCVCVCVCECVCVCVCVCVSVCVCVCECVCGVLQCVAMRSRQILAPPLKIVKIRTKRVANSALKPSLVFLFPGSKP